MTSYWKPRWENMVLFGSFKDLNYRIDIRGGKKPFFSIRTGSGPGFSAVFTRSEGKAGYDKRGISGNSALEKWEKSGECRGAIERLLEFHFSTIEVKPDSIVCLCEPLRDDVLPEGSQLNWCLSLVYLLWSFAGEDKRVKMRKAEFIG